MALLAVAAIVSTVGLAGCRHKSKTPEDAYQRFAEAIKKGTARRCSTRWTKRPAGT